MNGMVDRRGTIGRGFFLVLAAGLTLGTVGCGGSDSGGGGGGGGDNNNPPPSSSANQFAYVINSGSNTVQAYTADGSNGDLTPAGGQGLQPTGNFPHHLDVDKAGRFIYISNHDANFVTGYKITADGSLTPINPSANGSPVTNLLGTDPTDNNPHSSVIDTSGQFIYVVAGVPPALSTLKTYTINGSTGVLTQIGTTGTLAQCSHGHNVTISPNNSFLFLACEDSGVVYSFSRDAGTGQLTNLGPTIAGTSAPAVTVDPGTRFVFVGTTNSVSVFSISGTGTLSPILAGQNNFAAGNTPHSLTVDSSGQFLYTANINTASISGFQVDQSTGALTPLSGSPYQTGGDPNYILLHPNGKVLYTADASNTNGNNVARFTINPDGTLTRTNDVATFPTGSGTNGIGMTKF